MKVRSSVFPLLATAVIAGAVGLAGCNAPPVERTAEMKRFQTEIKGRADSFKLVPGAVISMKECEDIALKNNLSLAIQQLTLRLEDDKVRLALSGGLPHFSANYDYSRRSNSSAAKFGNQEIEMQDRTQENFTLAATIPVLDYGMTYYAWQIARDQRTQQQLLLKRAAQELKRDVRIAYARHASALRQVKLAQVNVAAAEQVLKVSETMEREALATHAEVAVVRATMSEVQVELTVEQRKVEETRLQLLAFMSLPPNTAIVVDETLPELPTPPTDELVANLEEHALLLRPEMQVQDLQRHISANTVRHEVAAFFPRVDANGAFNWSNSSMAVNPAFLLYGFTVASSLLDGGSQIWRYGLADKERTVQEEQTILLSLGVMYDVNLRALQLQRDRETIKSLVAMEEARRKAFEEILSLYKAGLQNEAGTAQALSQLNVQSQSVDRAQTDYLVTWYQFQDATQAEEPVTPPATAPATAPAATTQPTDGTQPEKGTQP
jgi:outer membrane protein TolC